MCTYSSCPFCSGKACDIAPVILQVEVNDVEGREVEGSEAGAV